MTEFTFSRFAYFDTNIVSHYVKNELLRPGLFDYLRDNDLTLGIGEAQASELSDLRSLHRDVVRFFVSVPTGIIKGWSQILNEEVEAYPSGRTQSLLAYPLNAILLEDNGFDNLVSFLSSRSLAQARSDQLGYARQMSARHVQLKSNFPPSQGGKYLSSQADEFSSIQVMQWLATEHREFLRRFQSPGEVFNATTFLSIRTYGYVIFYKYYLGRRKPKRLSDFADLAHSFSLPYCHLAVMERDLCNVLNQIKKKHDVLQLPEIHDIDFLDTIHS